MEETLRSVYVYLLHTEHELEHYLLNDDKVNLVESIPWVLSSALVWGVLHNLFHEQSKYWVSTFHSLALAFAGALNLFFVRNNQNEHLVFYFMAGYFLADFFISKLFFPKQRRTKSLVVLLYFDIFGTQKTH